MLQCLFLLLSRCNTGWPPWRNFRSMSFNACFCCSLDATRFHNERLWIFQPCFNACFCCSLDATISILRTHTTTALCFNACFCCSLDATGIVPLRVGGLSSIASMLVFVALSMQPRNNVRGNTFLMASMLVFVALSMQLYFQPDLLFRFLSLQCLFLLLSRCN